MVSARRVSPAPRHAGAALSLARGRQPPPGHLEGGCAGGGGWFMTSMASPVIDGCSWFMMSFWRLIMVGGFNGWVSAVFVGR